MLFAVDEGLVLMVVGGPLWVLFGIVILWVLGMLPASDVPLRRSLGRSFFLVLGWLFIVLGLLASLSLLGVVILVIIAMIVVRAQRTRQQTMLWTLAVAAERSIPLYPAIEAVARERSGLAAQEVRALARLVQEGIPLPQALAIVGRMVPEDALVPIQVGQELGALPEGLRLATSPSGWQQLVWDQTAGKLAYLSWPLLFFPGIIVFMMLKIAPAYQKIFVDFGMELPTLSRYMIGMFGNHPGIWAWVGLLAALLGLYALLRYVGAITWDLPPMGWVTRNLHTARVLESLAMTAERGKPLPKIVATLARAYPKYSIRRRLQTVLVEVANGGDLSGSLRAARLISRADAAMLDAAQRVGNLAWALRELADGKRRRLAYRVQAWLQVLFPASILCLGVFVLFFWVGFFLPLIALIQKLT